MKVVLLFAALAGVGLAAQGQPPTFSAGNRTVAVYATVTETGGRIVPVCAVRSAMIACGAVNTSRKSSMSRSNALTLSVAMP